MKKPSHGTSVFKRHCPQSIPGLHTTSGKKKKSKKHAYINNKGSLHKYRTPFMALYIVLREGKGGVFKES